jgi:DNA-binding transcriptional ArsR family regulator
VDDLGQSHGHLLSARRLGTGSDSIDRVPVRQRFPPYMAASAPQRDMKRQKESSKADRAGYPPESEIWKAFANPLRYRIVMALGEREASPTELAESLGCDLRRVHEQIVILERDFGFIELVETDLRKGGTQHFYRATIRPLLDAEEWSMLTPTAQHHISVAIARNLVDDLHASIDSGAFNAHPHRALLTKPMVVDEQGFADADASALEHLNRLNEIEAESTSRLVRSGEPGIDVRTATVVYPAAPDGPTQPQ